MSNEQNGNGWKRWIGYAMAGLILAGILGVFADSRANHSKVEGVADDLVKHEDMFGHAVMDARMTSIEDSKDLLIHQLETISDRLSASKQGREN